MFSCQSAFRAACDKALARAETRAIHIDLSQVEYLDSSALGMLLLLKEKATPLSKRARILGARGIAMQVLEVAHFHRFFEIMPASQRLGCG